MSSNKRIKLRIVHETNPLKYYPALIALGSEGSIELIGAHRASAVKEWFRSGIRENVPLTKRTRQSFSDLWFRLCGLSVRNETVLIALAPWDFRLLYFYHLLWRNKIIYHTSWPSWHAGIVPRRPLFFRQFVISMWARFLKSPNVTCVAVTEAAATSLKLAMCPNSVSVIPHSVPSVFFEMRERPKETYSGFAPLRTLFVGEITDKKGITLLLEVFSRLDDRRFNLMIVGTGNLDPIVRKAAVNQKNIQFVGSISNRGELARLMAGNDVLIVPSRRTAKWEELFGAVIIEAMAAGLVVIASDHVGPRSVLSDKLPQCLVPENDPAALQDRLAQFESNRHLLGTLGDQTVTIAADYHIKNVSARWMEILNVANS